MPRCGVDAIMQPYCSRVCMMLGGVILHTCEGGCVVCNVDSKLPGAKVDPLSPLGSRGIRNQNHISD